MCAALLQNNNISGDGDSQRGSFSLFFSLGTPLTPLRTSEQLNTQVAGARLHFATVAQHKLTQQSSQEAPMSISSSQSLASCHSFLEYTSASAIDIGFVQCRWCNSEVKNLASTNMLESVFGCPVTGSLAHNLASVLDSREV